MSHGPGQTPHAPISHPRSALLTTPSALKSAGVSSGTRPQTRFLLSLDPNLRISAIQWRSFNPALEFGTNFPEVRKDGLKERFLQITNARGAACSLLEADRPLYHLHMAVSPFLKSLIEIDE